MEQKKINLVNGIKCSKREEEKENQSYMWLMSFGMDWVAGMLRKLSRQQLICFKTGEHLKQWRKENSKLKSNWKELKSQWKVGGKWLFHITNKKAKIWNGNNHGSNYSLYNYANCLRIKKLPTFEINILILRTYEGEGEIMKVTLTYKWSHLGNPDF